MKMAKRKMASILMALVMLVSTGAAVSQGTISDNRNCAIEIENAIARDFINSFHRDNNRNEFDEIGKQLRDIIKCYSI